MCGLFFTNQPVARGARRSIEFLLDRRGMLKTCWLASEEGSVLAHSLLPIRGHQPRRQPVCGRNGRLLFTGELWSGPRNVCDTDQVLDALERIGPRRAFASFDGNWAIVYLRTRDHSIHFATDRLGEQPLHYAYEGARLSIATEIKTLIAAGHRLSAIKPVVPGRHYRFARALSDTAYCRRHSRAVSKLMKWSARALRARIREAVREQATARDFDRDVAILFSGGLDSSVIAYEAARLGIRRAFTVALHEGAPDALHAATVARDLGLRWQLICVEPAAPRAAIAAGEVANRSIVEELTMHWHLAAHLRKLGFHIALTGCGADEVFVGYQHLLGRMPHDDLQSHFLATYYRFDLRAFNKLYGGFQIELRNPFLSRRVIEYAQRIPGATLIGPRRELKVPLRVSYGRLLGDTARRPKVIARQSMGVKSLFAQRLGESPYLFRPLYKSVLGSRSATQRVLRDRD